MGNGEVPVEYWFYKSLFAVLIWTAPTQCNTSGLIFIIVELAEDEEQFGFKIVFHGTGNRSYILGAESQESMEQWMKALACASYDYMKLMVAELQRQLDEMEGKYIFKFLWQDI